LGNKTRNAEEKRVFNVFWTHNGNVVSVAYDTKGNVTEIQDNNG
jgi:hypothetical protein